MLNYKKCTVCNLKFEATTENFKKQPKGKFGVGSWCLSCYNKHQREHYKANKERILEIKRSYYKNNREYILKRKKEYQQENRQHNNEKARKSKIKRLYGISFEEKMLLYEKQEGICFICNEFMLQACVDHDHSSGKIRGLLCQACNKGLGIFKDNALCLQRAIQYLQGELG